MDEKQDFRGHDGCSSNCSRLLKAEAAASNHVFTVAVLLKIKGV